MNVKSLVAAFLVIICTLMPGLALADQKAAEQKAIEQLVSELSLNTH
jgi:hypothetical protein